MLNQTRDIEGIAALPIILSFPKKLLVFLTIDVVTVTFGWWDSRDLKTLVP